MRSITLIIPGLLPPPPGVTREHLPATPMLDRLLARADRLRIAEDYYRLLFERFDLEINPSMDYPLAALSHLADAGHADGLWLRADPVHLSAGSEGMVLIDGHMLKIGPDEAEALAGVLQPWLAELGATIEVLHPQRWYLHLKQQPAIQTTPLTAIRGRDVSMALPCGRDRTRWRQLFNEIQMLLHEMRINRDRSRRGALTVNSLWFWGLGELPQPAARCEPDMVFTDDAVARGLAQLYKVSVKSLPATGDDCLLQAEGAERLLIVNDEGWAFGQYGDADGWLAFIELLERDWLRPLYQGLRWGRLRRFDILLPGAGFRIVSRHLWRVWRRPAVLTSVNG